jgi:hypothetical protein
LQHVHEALTARYFDFLAARFPVMCASDEFHFLPRVRSSGQYLDCLDDLDKGTVEECIATVSDLREECRRLAAGTADLEAQIDRELLDGSMAGLLLELEKKQSWRHNPLLYLKIAFIGLDHALTKPAASAQERLERVLARMDAVPRLFRQAVNNLRSLPASYHQASLAMARDCSEYLQEIVGHPQLADSPRFLAAHGVVRHALSDFARFLEGQPCLPDGHVAVPVLHETLREHFLSLRSPAEIVEIAREEWHDNLEQVQRLGAVIDAGKPWRDLYHGHHPSGIEETDLDDLYRREMTQLRRFFLENGFQGIATGPLPWIVETPAYLRSVRSSASFSAACSLHPQERDLFYLTTRLPAERSEDAGRLLRERLRRERQFLAAHEVFPGHFALDATRRSLANPVRSQVESPLFYEGWAYYVESLLVDYGYVSHPLDQLVDCRRRLWRAARCQIDIGLATGSLGLEEALGLLLTTGFSAEEAKNQVERFQLNPGYQLCYSLGRYEIMQLRSAHGGRMGLEAFHRELLQGGEIPFHWAARRLAAMSRSGEHLTRTRDIH